MNKKIHSKHLHLRCYSRSHLVNESLDRLYGSCELRFKILYHFYHLLYYSTLPTCVAMDMMDSRMFMYEKYHRLSRELLDQA